MTAASSTWLHNEKKTKPLIIFVSILIPAVVIALRYIPRPELSDATMEQIYLLPKMNALLNGSAFLLLIAALVAIKAKRIEMHKRLTTSALLLSVLFLVSYVAFHLLAEETSYGGVGFLKGVYYFVLLTHVLLSAVIVPFALFAYSHGLSGRIDRHRKMVRYTFPMWLYVTFTGPLVYVMISPYYPF